METIKSANKVIKEAIALLPDDAKVEYKARSADIFIYEAIANAMAMVNKNEEKEAMLVAYSIQEANRVIGALWRLELLPKELEVEYRKLPKIPEVQAGYNKFIDARNERKNEVLAAHKKINDEERELEIFMGVVNGVSAKEAEKKYNEYQKQVAQAMGK